MVLLIFLIFVLNGTAAGYSTVDSLLEEAKYQAQVAGRPDDAARLYEKVLSGFAQDSNAMVLARRGLSFCRMVMGETAKIETLAVTHDDKRKGEGYLLMWRQAFGSGNITGAVLSGERIVLTVDEGYLVVVRKSDGKILWARRGVDSRIAPAVLDDRIFMPVRNGSLFCLDGMTGEPLWNSRCGTATSPVRVGPGNVLFLSAGREAIALDSRSGKRLWRTVLPDESRMAEAPVLCAGYLLFRMAFSGIAALNPKSGAIVWTSTDPALLPLISGEETFFIVNKGSLYCLDGFTGKTLWNRENEAVILSLKMEDHGPLCLLDESGRLSGLDPESGRQLFTFQASPGALLQNRGRLFVADRKGRISAYSEDGSPLWLYPTGETDHLELVILGNALGVLTENSGFFLLDPTCSRKEDPRLAPVRLEAEMMIKSGLSKSAERSLQEALSTLAPGDPAMNRQLAHLLLQEGRIQPALDAFERYIASSDPLESGDKALLDNLRTLTGAVWTASVEHVGRFSPFYLQDNRIAVLGVGEVRILSLENGELLWRYRLRKPDAALQTGLMIGSELFCHDGINLICLDLSSQHERFHLEVRENITQFAAAGNDLAIGTWNNGCLFVNRVNGRAERRDFRKIKAIFPLTADNALWLVGLEGGVMRRHGNDLQFLEQGEKLSALPVMTNGHVILQTASGFCRVYAAGTGNKELEFRTGQPFSSVTADASRLYFIFPNSGFGALDLKDGKRIWQRRDMAYGFENIQCSDGLLAFSGNGRVVAMRAEDGKTVQECRVVGRVASTLLSGKTLLVRAENGILYRFDVK
ncbi:MAG: hypothetical protein A2293_05685 [Elusimicrobia bacterium RIFOXYB2_FULL_49_7]|nr:MAG: hypothetical protein A2293_05685 [Elusimicrobia bacterium RIFOXYB2_FULL_49_7]